MIVLLENRRVIDSLHALKDKGFVVSTIRTPSGRSLNVAREIPTLTNVVELRPRPQSAFDFRPRSA